MNRYLNIVLGLSLTLSLFTPAIAEDQQDHPLLPKLPGLIVKKYDLKDFDSYILPKGKLDNGEAGEVIELEGKLTRIFYRAPSTKSTLEIYRYYEDLLNKAGFKTIFSGKGSDLGNWDSAFYRHYVDIYSTETDQRYICAQSTASNTYTSIYTTLSILGYVVAQVDVIETGKITANETAQGSKTIVELNSIAKPDFAIETELISNGKVIFKNITFDEGTNKIRTGSEPALIEIAGLIKRNPNRSFVLNYYTDSVGSVQYCLNLSKQRADAVLRQIVLVYGADKKRVRAYGMGFVSPEKNTSSETAYGNRLEVLTEYLKEN